MLVLDATDRTIKIILAGAVTTNQLQIVASYVDVAAPDVYEPGTAHLLTADAADVTAVIAPASGKSRQIKYLGVYNADTAVATVTVKLDDSAVQRTLVKVAALPVGGALVYTDGEGWRTYAASGALL